MLRLLAELAAAVAQDLLSLLLRLLLVLRCEVAARALLLLSPLLQQRLPSLKFLLELLKLGLLFLH